LKIRISFLFFVVLLHRFSNPRNFLQPGVIEAVVSSIKKKLKKLNVALERGSGAM
jgi:hypothetical protein